MERDNARSDIVVDDAHREIFIDNLGRVWAILAGRAEVPCPTLRHRAATSDIRSKDNDIHEI